MLRRKVSSARRASASVRNSLTGPTTMFLGRRLKMDGGRMVELDPRQHAHLDHGYAMTSHSSQGQTADRVLIHVDTELGAKDLLNSRMAYVSVSRGRYDAQIYTSSVSKLGQELGRDVSHSPAIQREPVVQKIEKQHTNEIGQGLGLGL